jgi:hypothetical protein
MQPLVFPHLAEASILITTPCASIPAKLVLAFTFLFTETKLIPKLIILIPNFLTIPIDSADRFLKVFAMPSFRYFLYTSLRPLVSSRQPLLPVATTVTPFGKMRIELVGFSSGTCLASQKPCNHRRRNLNASILVLY